MPQFTYEFKGDFDYWKEEIIKYYRLNYSRFELKTKSDWESEDVRVFTRHYEINGIIAGNREISFVVTLVGKGNTLWINASSFVGITNYIGQLMKFDEKEIKRFEEFFNEKMNELEEDNYEKT